MHRFSAWLTWVIVLLALNGVLPHVAEAADGPAVLVKTINPNGGTDARDFTTVGSLLFFTADDGVHGRELWQSDGTPDGTTLVADLVVGTPSSNPHDLTVVNGALFFVANDALWRSDGTALGTVQVNAPVTHVLAANNGLFFLMSTSECPMPQVNYCIFDDELWYGDGTPGGSTLLDRFYTFAQNSPFNVGRGTLTLHVVANHHVVLTYRSDGRGASSGIRLVVSDGTPNGTRTVASFAFLPNDTAMNALATLGNQILFDGSFACYVDGPPTRTTQSRVNICPGVELWQTSIVTDEQRLVRDINPDLPACMAETAAATCHSSNPSDFVTVGDTLFFVADDGTHGRELWASNGSAAGTRMVKDLIAGGCDAASCAAPTNLAAVNGALWFTVDAGSGGTLWRSDGTAQGTLQLAAGLPNLTRVVPIKDGGALFLAAPNATHLELWQSNDTPDGTLRLQSFTVAPTASATSPIVNLAVAGSNVLFSTVSADRGVELWKLPVATVNFGPVAAAYDVFLRPNTTRTGTLPAHDPDGDPLTYRVITNAQHGTVTLTDAARGTFTYVPTLDFQGTDSFHFAVNDGTHESAPATVTLRVAAHELFAPLVER